MKHLYLKRVLLVLLGLPVVTACAAHGPGSSRPPILESPKGAALRTVVVPGRTADLLDRGVPTESPKGAALRVRRVPGVTPDRIDRSVPTRSPRSEVNFPTAGHRR